MIDPKKMRIIVSWWIYYQQDALNVGDCSPDQIRSWIEYAESHPESCDAELKHQYNEYCSQIA